jgi:hypothetical protein
MGPIREESFRRVSRVLGVGDRMGYAISRRMPLDYRQVE